MNVRYDKINKTYSAWTRGMGELLREPLKPMLHPSEWRLRWVGFFIAIGNPIFYIVWANVLTQPFEYLPARILISCFGIILLVNIKKILEGIFFWNWFYAAIMFIQLPLFFLFMAYKNNFNTVWLGSCVAMVLIFYQATDWRIAATGTLTAIVGIFALIYINDAHYVLDSNLKEFIFVFIFSWVSATVLGASAANLAKQNMLNTAFNLGVMAHELRTPISSVGLLSTILKNKYLESKDESLLSLSNKLNTLVKTINSHIDNQIVNSKIIGINTSAETASIKSVIDNVLVTFPHKNSEEELIIRYKCVDDFTFSGSSVLFTQVFNNLIRNSLKALAAKELEAQFKRIEITSYISNKSFGKKMACIDITDNGIGIKPEDIHNVLEPFFSTNDELGHGLGLSFCKKVVRASNGRLLIKSLYGSRTTITIELPLV
jgi:two-component system, CAI-1 autoinducer sensor kinase/phosphatase CqsS